MQLSPKQKEFWNAPFHRWNIKHGATRSGKTYLDYFMIPRRIRERAEKDGLIVLLGNTKGTLQRNLIEPMQNLYGTALVSSIRSDNTAQMFGERVHCLGADNKKHVDRLRGTSIKYCYGDEIVSWEQEVFEMLKSRLDKPYSTADGTCNTKGPDHWLKKFIDGDGDIFSQHYALDDNPFMDETVRAEMKNEHKGVFYDRYILGEWALAEGLIYPMFNRATHVVASEPRQYEKFWVSGDYGTHNPTAFLLWGLCEGVYYLVEESYYDGRQKAPRTDDEHYEALRRLIGGRKVERVIIDPSAASFITYCKRKGEYWTRNADNSVLDGIRETGTALNRGLIKICENCKNTIAEFGLYAWNEKTVGEDKPLKESDHCLDALRYFVKTWGIAKRNLKSLPA